MITAAQVQAVPSSKGLAMPDSNRFLQGPFAPVEEEITAFDLPVTGTVPAGLNGCYLRNGPNRHRGQAHRNDHRERDEAVRRDRPGGRGPPGRAHAAGDHAGHLRQPRGGHAGDGCLAPGRARPAAQGADLGRRGPDQSLLLRTGCTSCQPPPHRRPSRQPGWHRHPHRRASGFLASTSRRRECSATSAGGSILTWEERMSAISTAGSGGRSKSLVLTAMIFAVAMTFIDQTIVSIAAPTIQVAVGTALTGGPPHRSQRALLTHWAPAPGTRISRSRYRARRSRHSALAPRFPATGPARGWADADAAAAGP